MSITPVEERLEYTVEKVAVNAVMAGARPEHFPVILAIASSNQTSLPSSTGSYGCMVVVNGPVGREIGMNGGGGAFGPFNYANAVIGRAWTLMSINFGDARLGDTYMATLGNGLSFTNMCVAENEEKYITVGELLRRGLDVYMTLVDDQQIDCIIRQEKIGQLRYLDIQIKARSNQCIEKDGGFFPAMHVRNPRENFYFIFYSEHANTYWIVPSLELV